MCCLRRYHTFTDALNGASLARRCYMVAMSFGTGANTRVSNELGRGNALAAKRVFRVAICIVVRAMGMVVNGCQMVAQQ